MSSTRPKPLAAVVVGYALAILLLVPLGNVDRHVRRPGAHDDADDATPKFAREGATVFIAGRKRDRGESLASEIKDAGGAAHFVGLDIVNQDQWDAAVAQVRETAGALHVLMNIVGSNAMAKFPGVDVGQWNTIFDCRSAGCSRARPPLQPRPGW
jgi:hypothetical protein